MNAPATVQDLNKATGQQTANITTIRGRIIEVKRMENGVFTAVALPAPDSYSHPQAVEIRSKHLLGKPHDDITCRCQVGGYRRAYKDKMGDQQYATNVTLNAVED